MSLLVNTNGSGVLYEDIGWDTGILVNVIASKY